MKENKNITWRIVPQNTPTLIKQCSKCNKKSEFYCSEKFRVNANQSRVDIWLIYKCHKCDSTWNLAIKKGIKPRELPAALFNMFIANDKSLAWQYAFDRHFLRQNSCVVDYTNVEYTVEVCESHDETVLAHIQSPFCFDLKLVKFLAKVLCTTVGQIKKLVENGTIYHPDIDIIKHRIKADIRGLHIACDLCYNAKT